MASSLNAGCAAVVEIAALRVAPVRRAHLIDAGKEIDQAEADRLKDGG
jgi:hypothetical protein